MQPRTYFATQYNGSPLRPVRDVPIRDTQTARTIYCLLKSRITLASNGKISAGFKYF